MNKFRDVSVTGSTSVNKIVQILNKIIGKNIEPIHAPAVIEPKMTLA